MSRAAGGDGHGHGHDHRRRRIFYKDWGPKDAQPIVFHHAAFSETDFTEDLKAIDVPTLVMHGDDDQIVPIAASAMLAAKLLRSGTLKVYEKLSHGMCTTHPELINADLHAFVQAHA